MYLHIMTEDEQKQVVRALRGPEFVRKNHGSLYDRGSADSHYWRMPNPHYGGVGGDSGKRVDQLTAEEVAEYQAGYTYNELYGEKKDYR
jgi:hypothetical protein